MATARSKDYYDTAINVHIPPCDKMMCQDKLLQLAERLRQQGITCQDKYRPNGHYKTWFEMFIKTCSYTVLHKCPQFWKKLSVILDISQLGVAEVAEKIMCITFDSSANEKFQREETNREDPCESFFLHFSPRDISSNIALSDFVSEVKVAVEAENSAKTLKSAKEPEQTGLQSPHYDRSEESTGNKSLPSTNVDKETPEYDDVDFINLSRDTDALQLNDTFPPGLKMASRMGVPLPRQNVKNDTCSAKRQAWSASHGKCQNLKPETRPRCDDRADVRDSERTVKKPCSNTAQNMFDRKEDSFKSYNDSERTLSLGDVPSHMSSLSDMSDTEYDYYLHSEESDEVVCGDSVRSRVASIGYKNSPVPKRLITDYLHNNYPEVEENKYLKAQKGRHFQHSQHFKPQDKCVRQPEDVASAGLSHEGRSSPAVDDVHNYDTDDESCDIYETSSSSDTSSSSVINTQVHHSHHSQSSTPGSEFSSVDSNHKSTADDNSHKPFQVRQRAWATHVFVPAKTLDDADDIYV